MSVCLQISWLALLEPLGSAAVNPTFLLMGETFGLTVKEVSYGEDHGIELLYSLPSSSGHINTNSG